MSAGNYSLLPTSSPQHASRRRKDQPKTINCRIEEPTNPRTGVCIVEHFAIWHRHSIGIYDRFRNIQNILQQINLHENIDIWNWTKILCGWFLLEPGFRNPCQYQIFSYLAAHGASILGLFRWSKIPSPLAWLCNRTQWRRPSLLLGWEVWIGGDPSVGWGQFG